MKFFDKLIDDFHQLCDGLNFDSRKFSADNIAPCDDHLQIIMQRDTAFELDGIGLELVTTEPVDDAVVVIESLKEDSYPEKIGDMIRYKSSVYGITKITYYRKEETV